MIRFPNFARFRPLLALLLAPVLAGASEPVGPGAFDPNFNGLVHAVVVQADGAVVMGGAFTRLHPGSVGAPQTREHLARFRGDGRLDPEFSPSFSGPVRALALDREGRLLVGGGFDEVIDDGETLVRRGLARLLPDGSVDRTFAPQFEDADLWRDAVTAVTHLADGTMLVGGAFRAVRNGPDEAALARAFLVRLSATGRVIESFDPRPNHEVLVVAPLADGGFLAGGAFTALGDTPVQRLARFGADGTHDVGFTFAADNLVRALAVETDGAILVGGDFLQVRAVGETAWASQLFVVRLTADGRRDATFQPRPNARVNALAIEHAGSILLGGEFTQFLPALAQSSVGAARLARITRSGEVDTTFRPGPSAAVRAIGLQEDGGVVIGGHFTSLTDGTTGTTTSRYHGARVHENGRVDSEFFVGSRASLAAVAPGADGTLVIGGLFNSIGGAARSNMARLLADGLLDPDFAPEVNGTVNTVLVQADGKVVIGGAFTTINEEYQPYLARLNADGTHDATFDPQPNGAVYAIVAETDGSFTVGGTFTQFSPKYDADTSPDDYTSTGRLYLARVKSDGTIDADWTPATDGTVYALRKQPDGRLLVGGAFTGIGTETRSRLARLNTDGSVDKTFDPSPNGAVRAIALGEANAVVFAGDFTLLGLDDGEGDDDDGDELTNDDAERWRIARVSAIGELDKTFRPALDNSVTAVHVLADGDLLVGGGFSYYATSRAAAEDEDYVLRPNLVRLNADGSLDEGVRWHPNSPVALLQPLADGTVLVGGQFTTAYASDGRAVRTEPPLLRFDPTAGVDEDWAVRQGVDDERYIAALTVQRSGHVLAGGRFEGLAGIDRQHIARFTAEGTFDGNFNLRPDGPVEALLDRVTDGLWENLRTPVAWLSATGTDLPGANYTHLQALTGQVWASAREADGSILLGGLFANNAGSSGPNLVRLRTDGTFDSSFRPNPNATVNRIVVQPDGGILVAGSFTEIAGQSRSYVARLLPNGTFDASFTAQPQSSVNVIALQPDGKILLGGSFRVFSEDDGEGDDDDGDEATDDDFDQPYLARVGADGKIDREFRPKPNGTVHAIQVHASGQITVGGEFTSITIGETTTVRSRLARLTAAGALVEAFNPAPEGTVRDLLLQEDGKLIVAGAFTLFTALSDHEDDDDDGDGDTDSDGKEVADEDADVYYLARLNADDTLDTGFAPTPNYTVWRVVATPDGGLVILGDFGALYPNDAEYGINRAGVARLRADGTVDPTFNPNADGTVRTVQAFADGSVMLAGNFETLGLEAVFYVGGQFAKLNGEALPYLARVQSDGNVDGTYKPAPNGAVHALVGTPDGRMVVAGAFTQLGGFARSRLARLDSTGAVESAFAPQINGAVRAVLLDRLGGIVIAGGFTQVNGVPRSGLARLRSDGTLDPDWNAAVVGDVSALALLVDGRIAVAGDLATINGAPRSGLALLDASGATVTGFAPVFDGPVHAVVVRSDGRLVAGGAFATVNGSPSSRLATLNPDGSLFAAGGSDTNGAVLALGIDREGRVMAGGTFTRFDGVSRSLLARSGGASSFGQAMVVDEDGGGLTWVQTGAAAAPTSVRIAVSQDGLTWTERGLAVRATGGDIWRWQGAALPIAGEYVVRVRMIAAGNRHGSTSIREYHRHFIGTRPSGYGYASTLPVRFEPVSGDLGDWLPGGAGIVLGGSSGGGDDGDGGEGDEEDPDLVGSRLINVSTRVALADGEKVTLGFVIEGTEARRMLLRAVGPGLDRFLGEGTLPMPELTLQRADGTVVGRNAGWETSDQVVAWFNQAGAFGLDAGSADAVLAPELAPGVYTLDIRDLTDAGGIVLAEIYDLGRATVADRLINLSTLSRAGTGDETLVVGFVVAGNTPKQMLIRAAGPALRRYGLEDNLEDVALLVTNAAGTRVARNEDWGTALDGGASATAIAARAAAVGAFAFDAGSGDAAVLVELPPGVYSVQLQTAGAAGERGLVEIYDVSP